MLKQLSKPTQDKLERLLSNVGDMSLKRRARRIIEDLNPQDGEKIADFGCGTGYYLFLLSSLPIKVNLTGFDCNEKAINEARSFLHGKNIEFVTGDLHKIPFKDKSFDKIVMSEVLEHVAKDGEVLKEVYRVLRPGGVLVVSVPSTNYPFLWDPINFVLQRVCNTHIKKGFFSGLWNGHLRLYNTENLKKEFEKARFEVEIIKELTFWCLPFNHYIINLIARLLYDVKISSKISDNLSKFKETKKPLMINLAFKLVNLIDRLNGGFPQKHGVNILVKARKS